MSDVDPVITPDDIRRAGHCAPGFVDWCKAYGISVPDFFAGKVRASAFLATGDANGARVVELKREAESK